VRRLGDGLRPESHRVSHLACLHGCLRYLNVRITPGWLFGVTGHAFLLNVQPSVCVSGPSVYNWEWLMRLVGHVGGDVTFVKAGAGDDDFVRHRERAWRHARAAIDAGNPCYGWQMDGPEFHVIAGYDDVGYRYVDAENPRGRTAWDVVGGPPTGMLCVASVARGDASDDVGAIRGGLELALTHTREGMEGDRPWSGADALAEWADAMDTGRASASGVAYNAAVWEECRRYAVEFMWEAKERLRGRLAPVFNAAAEEYDRVARAFGVVAGLFPYPPQGQPPPGRVAIASRALRDARDAEARAIDALEALVASL
jgi:hypothetical protein